MIVELHPLEPISKLLWKEQSYDSRTWHDMDLVEDKVNESIIEVVLEMNAMVKEEPKSAVQEPKASAEDIRRMRSALRKTLRTRSKLDGIPAIVFESSEILLRQ